MQKKVSKQSLAIVALSILLAICLALTGTYAAFTKTGTVKGVITFQNGIIASVTNFTYDSSATPAVSGSENLTVEGSTINITNNELQLKAGDVAGKYVLDTTATILHVDPQVNLDAKSIDAYAKVVITVENGTSSNALATAATNFTATTVTGWTNTSWAYADNKFTITYTYGSSGASKLAAGQNFKLLDFVKGTTTFGVDQSQIDSADTVNISFAITFADVDTFGA